LNSGVLLLNATLYMRVLLYFVISIPVLVYYSYKSDYLSSIFIFATFISCFFSTLDVLAIYYDATLNSKINTCINVIGLFISLLLRWFIVLLDWEPVYLSIPIILTGFIPFVIRICIFSSIKKRVVFSKRKKIQYVKYLFKSGYNFVISDISVALYTRLSFFIISFFASKTEVGIYSVALALGNSWGFVNSSIISSFFTKIYSLKNEADSLIISAKLNLLIFVIGLIITIGTLIFAPYFFFGFMVHYIPMLIYLWSYFVCQQLLLV
ncbi:TPA: polysaccharide biosynthesis protein, partial [Klebsiella pneumoniae]